MDVVQNLHASRLSQVYQGSGKQSFDIEGILLEKNENMVKVDMGDDRIIEAKLKNPVDGEVGKQISIDKSQVLWARVLPKEEAAESVQNTNVYEEILQANGISVTAEAIEAVKALESFDLPVNREWIETYISSKGYFQRIFSDLDYDTAVKLTEKEIDFSKISLDKAAAAIEEVKAEKEAFSLLKFLGIKKEMTTEEAEQVAQKIYGSTMGKDITDIIKALHRAKAPVTRKNIDKIHETFYKLDKLKDLDADVFAKVFQQEEKASIESLYNHKFYVKGQPAAEISQISNWAADKYEGILPTTDKLGEKELEQMKENMIQRLEAMDIEASEENLQIARELVRAGLPLHKENMSMVIEMKEAVKILVDKMDKDTASQMIQEGVDIQKEDIRILVSKLDQWEKTVQEIVDNDEAEKLENVLDVLNRLKEIEVKDFIELVKGKVDFKISKLERILFPDSQKLAEKSQGIDYSHLKKSVQEFSKEEMEGYVNPIDSSNRVLIKGIGKILDVADIFQRVGQLKFETISYHIARGIPLKLANIGMLRKEGGSVSEASERMEQEAKATAFVKAHASEFRITGIPKGIAGMIEASKSLLLHKVPLQVSNVKRVFEAYGQYNYVRDNLTSNIVLDSVHEGQDLMDMELSSLKIYVEGRLSAQENGTQMKTMEWFHNLFGNGQGKEDTVLPMLLKNNIPLTLNEYEGVSQFLRNQQQVGQKMTEIFQSMGTIAQPELGEQLLKLEHTGRTLSQKIKDGDGDVEQAYDQLIEGFGQLQQEMAFSQDENQQSFRQHMKELMKSLEVQKKLSKGNRVLQLPVIMGEQFKNLQVFVQNNSSFEKSRKGELSTFLNLDTETMGQVQAAMKIEKDKISFSFVVGEREYRERMEKYEPMLKETLQSMGYRDVDVSYEVKEDGHLLSGMEKEPTRGHSRRFPSQI